MGLFNFINRKREQWKTKKLEVLDEDIANNLLLFSQGIITAAQCIAALAYCTEKQISIITNLTKYPEETSRYLICFYIKYLQICLSNDIEFRDDKRLSPYNVKFMARWIAKYIYKNNKDLKEDSLKEYDKSLSFYFKRVNDNNISNIEILLENVATLIFENYNHIYDFDISDRKRKIKDILSINGNNLKIIVDESDSKKMLPKFLVLYEDGAFLDEWWKTY